MDLPASYRYVAPMTRIRARWRLLIVSILLLGGAVIGVSMALPGGYDTMPQVRPYDPMPRW